MVKTNETVFQSSCGSELYNSTEGGNSAKWVGYQIITIIASFLLD